MAQNLVSEEQVKDALQINKFNATRMVKYITHCDVYFSKRKKVYITLDFGDKLSKRYCTQIRTYEFLQMLISETEAYQDLNIDTLF